MEPRTQPTSPRSVLLPSGRGEGVDRQLDPRRSRLRRRLATTAAVLAAGAAAVAAITLLIGRQQRHLDRDTLTIATVERRAFQESITTTGTLLPRTTVYLDTVEGGRIEEIYVQEGSLVRRGQHLLRLSNNDLQLRLIATDAQRLAEVNRLRDLRFSLRQRDLEIRQRLAEMDFDIQQLVRRVASNERLFASQLISRQEKEQVEAELEYLRSKRDSTQEAYRQDAEHQQARIDQTEAEVQRMESSYSLIQQVLDGLVLEAPIAGQLIALNGEVGELKPAGSRLGQIDDLEDGYKVRAEVDEFYLDRVAPGQSAETLPISGRQYTIVVRRVYPEVRDGKFSLDLEFEHDPPEDLHRGQTVGFQLYLGGPETTLVLPRGAYYQTTGGQWVFVLEGEHRARRHPIRPGRQSAGYLEVLDGLEQGDRVIVSSYEAFKSQSQLVLD